MSDEYRVDDNLDNFHSDNCSTWGHYSCDLPIIIVSFGCPVIVVSVDSENFEAIVAPQLSRYFAPIDTLLGKAQMQNKPIVDFAAQHRATEKFWTKQVWKELPTPIPLFYVKE